MYQLVGETVRVELGSPGAKGYVRATQYGPAGVEEFDRAPIGADGGVSAFAVIGAKLEAFGYVLDPAASSANKPVYTRVYLPEEMLEPGPNGTADVRLIETLDRYLEQYPNDSHALYSRAYACSCVEDWSGAKVYAARALRTNPRHYGAQLTLAEALIALGETAAAVPYANAAYAFELANEIDEGAGFIYRQRLGLESPAQSYTVEVPSVTYYDGRGHIYVSCSCTLSNAALVVQDNRGSTLQILLRDIATVETRWGLSGMIAPNNVIIKIGTTAALEIRCSSKAQQQQVTERLRRAIARRQ